MPYAYLVVDRDGTEFICHGFHKPRRGDDFVTDGFWVKIDPFIELPEGTIQKIIGKQLTWDDEPFELEDDE